MKKMEAKGKMKMTQAKKKAFWQSLPATPYILWMALFIIIPLGMVVFFALTDPQGNFTLENIARGGEHMGVLLRSIKLAAIATRSVRADRLPAGLHPLPQKGLSEADAVYHGDAADVDELSAAHLCVDDHFGKQRPHQ